MTKPKMGSFADTFTELRGRIHNLLSVLPEYEAPIVSVFFDSSTQRDWNEYDTPIQTSWVGRITAGVKMVTQSQAATPDGAMRVLIGALEQEIATKADRLQESADRLKSILSAR
jgi:hypothetical protein